MSKGNRILIVDDDVNLLAGLNRWLGEHFDINVAETGQAALGKIEAEGPYSVVLCDMRMPGMDGIEVLQRMQECAPDTVRMMLTGNADQKTAADAINKGNVFRFFNKPIPMKDLVAGIEAGIGQYTLNLAARQLMAQYGRDDTGQTAKNARVRARLAEFKRILRMGDTAEGSTIVHIVNLAPFQIILSNRWGKIHGKVISIVDALISSSLVKGDEYRNIGDDIFLLMYPGLSNADGLIRARTLCEKICQKLLGDNFDPNAGGIDIIKEMQKIENVAEDSPGPKIPVPAPVDSSANKNIVDKIEIEYLPIWNPDSRSVDGYRASFRRKYHGYDLFETNVLQGGPADPLWPTLYKKMFQNIREGLESIEGRHPYIIIPIYIESISNPYLVESLKEAKLVNVFQNKIRIEIIGLDDDCPMAKVHSIVSFFHGLTDRIMVRISPDSLIIHELKMLGVNTIGVNFFDIQRSGLGRRGSYVIMSHFAKKSRSLGFDNYAWHVDAISDFQVMMATNFKSVSGAVISPSLSAPTNVRPLAQDIILRPVS